MCQRRKRLFMTTHVVTECLKHTTGQTQKRGACLTLKHATGTNMNVTRVVLDFVVKVQPGCNSKLGSSTKYKRVWHEPKTSL